VLFWSIVLLVGYPIAASRAARRGRAALSAVAGGSLLLLVVGVIGLGLLFEVRSTTRLLVYALAFLGPALLMPCALLWRPAGGPRAARGSFGIAAAGALAGLTVGWLLVVYVLRVW
jgi:hypothetical protein